MSVTQTGAPSLLTTSLYNNCVVKVGVQRVVPFSGLDSFSQKGRPHEGEDSGQRMGKSLIQICGA